MATVRTGQHHYDGDPLVGFMFKVTFTKTTVGVSGVVANSTPPVNLAAAYFTELSGLQDQSDVITHKAVGVDANGKFLEVFQKIPGRDDGGEITLKRGVTRDVDFWEWRNMVFAGDTEGARRDIQITLYDRAYNEVITFEYLHVWPSQISITGIEAASDAYVIEELTLQHEGFNFGVDWLNPPPAATA